MVGLTKKIFSGIGGFIRSFVLGTSDNTWERFSMDLSAKFEKSSIHGNYYQMAIIDVKSKYVWDFYLETKVRYILS